MASTSKQKRQSNWAKPYFFDEAAAFAHVESILWPDGPVCPRCGGVGNASRLIVGETTRIKKSKGKVVKGADGEPVTVTYPARHGLWKCKNKECRAQFTVRMGTLFQESRMPMTKWLQAIYLMAASKKGISTHQLKRVLECDQKSAWFLGHRIREAMAHGPLSPFGVGGGLVEIDETFIGIDPAARTDVKRRNTLQRNKVLTLVDRNSGMAKSVVIDDLKAETIAPIVEANVHWEAQLVTDEAHHYKTVARDYAAHHKVNHSKKEYVRKGDPRITTNTVEGYFGIFKRGMRGTYQHCAKRHLHRYLAEFDFRYNHRIAKGYDDSARATAALLGVVGKRLTYRGTDNSLA